MIPARIEGTTRYLGKPANWAPEQDGECAHLAIRDDVTSHGLKVMMSAWTPTPEELKRLNAGASVILCVCGTQHPPVWVAAGNPPE